MTLTLYDEFAGWGGSSQGSTAVPGVELALAANHAPIAIEVHNLNFPDADHYLGDVTKADITRFPRADLFWASPACPPFSNARGEKQFFDAATQAALFDDPEESPEDRAKRLDLVKRRALMEEVPRYLRAMADRGKPVVAGVVENVPQARRWDEHDRFRREIEAIGPYRTRLIALNAMHAQSVRTRRARDRYFLAYWLVTLGRDPDWDKWLRPKAWCPTCDMVVDAVQVFKEPGVDMGGYGVTNGQYVYWCPAATCRNRPIEPGVMPAASAIDWTLPPGDRIGERARPLKPATLARIEAGLRKFSGIPVLAPAGGTWRGEAYPVDEPMPSRTTRETDGLAVPPMLVPTEKRAGVATARRADDPFRTQTARLELALVQDPFWVLLRGGGNRGDGGAYGMDEPWTTFSAAGQHHAVIHPPAMVMRNNSSRGDGSEMSTPVDEPLRTLTTRGHQSLVSWDALMMPYYGTGVARPVTEPIGTLTTRDRYAVVQPTGVPAVEDCTFRMLAPLEIAAGMAFAADYKVTGTKREQVAGYGNAVCPPCAEVIMSALVEAITGEDVAACSA